MRKLFFLITVLFSIFSLNSTASNLLSNPDFEESPDLKGWNKGIYGDKKGKIGLVDIARSGNYGAGIYSSSEESWTFLRQIFNDIPKGKELTLVAWVFSSSRKAKIVITSGFVWGGSGAGHKSKRVSHSGSSHWEKLKVNIEVEELPVSVAVGFDYQSPDSQMVVDNLYLGIGSPSSVLKEYKVRKAKPKREGLAMDKVVIPQAIEGKKDVLISQIESFLDGYKSLKKRKAVSPNFLKVIDEKESFFREEIKKFKAKASFYVSSQKAISTDLWNKLKEPLQKQTNRIAPPVVYRKNPLSNVTPDDLPENISSLKTLEIYGAVNENISATLCFFNPSSYSVRILIRISDLEGPAKIRAKEFEVREALYIGKKDKVYADALSSPGEASSILVPGGETRQIWLSLDTKGFSPGSYEGKLRAIPLDASSGFEKDIKLNLEIFPFKLPSSLPISVLNWTGYLTEKKFKALSSFRVNVFHVTGLPHPKDGKIPDFSSIDEQVNRALSQGVALLEWWFMRESGWKEEYRGWVKGLIKHLNELGLGYDDYLLYPFDEYIGQKFVQVAKEIKSIDPKVRIFSDKLDSLDIVKKASPYIDVWCPYFWHIEKFPDSFQFMKKTGKPIWTYLTGNRPKDSASKYRFLPWGAFKYDLDGVCYWVYSDVDWNSISDYGFYYKAYEKQIPSRRWLSWGQGLSDYLYLTILDEAIKKTSDKEAKRAARLLLEEAVDEIMKSGRENPDLFYKWRRKIAEKIVAIKR